jgi:hypothetical protein
MKNRRRGMESRNKRKGRKRRNPMGLTHDLQLGRHATYNIGRYWMILKDIFSFNLKRNQIGKYRIILKTIETNKKGERIT